MKIFIASIDGKEFELDVYPDDKVSTIKNIISERVDVPVELQRLLFGGKELADDKLISDYNIYKDSMIFLVMCVHGG